MKKVLLNLATIFIVLNISALNCVFSMQYDKFFDENFNEKLSEKMAKKANSVFESLSNNEKEAIRNYTGGKQYFGFFKRHKI